MQSNMNNQYMNNRQPLQHINDNTNNTHHHHHHHGHSLTSHENSKLYPSISNENMDPSQKQMANQLKSVNNNNDDEHNIHAQQLNHANKANLYVRRHHHHHNPNHSIPSQQGPQKGNGLLSVPTLKIDVSQCSNLSADSLSTYNSNTGGLHSANSFTTNNDQAILSSASSMNSSCVGNAYYSHSHSFSDHHQNELQHVQHHKKKSKKQKKKKTDSLFKKLTNLVTNRRCSKESRDGFSENQERHKPTLKDQDGDIEIDPDEEDDDDEEAENQPMDEDMMDEAEEKQDDEDKVRLGMGMTMGMDEDGMFTPSTGNTPRLIKSHTPLSTEEYNEEMIDALIGDDTFDRDYIFELFQEEKNKCNSSLNWYTDNPSKLPFLHRRREAVDWICVTGVNFDLQRGTIYRTIYYFDKLCSEKNVNLSYLQMIAATALLIAIKWNEKEEKVPSLYQLSKACNKQYTPSSFKPMEVKVLNLLNFKLKIVLPIDFVSFYIDHECVFDDDSLDGRYNLKSNQRTKPYLEKFAIFFLDIISQNYTFWQYLPSVIAMSVIVASRRALKIKPYFNYKLIDLCHYGPSQINQCFEQIWNEYRTKYPRDCKRAEKLQPFGLNKFKDHPQGNNMDHHNHHYQQYRHTF